MASLNLEPEIAAVLDLLPPITLGDESLVEMRSLMAGLGGGAALPPGVVVDEHVVNDDGVIVRILRPAAATPAAPCLYWIHGGGFVMGDRAVDDAQLAGWVAEIGCVVVSVEYRLAPEHPYPLPLDDCYAGLTWVHDNAALLGIDLTRLGVGGTSAGGGLAASLSLLARDRGGFAIAFQLLDSPMLDDRRITPSSRLDDLAMWNKDSNAFGWRSYLGELFGTDQVPATAAPARATDLSGLPPALVFVGAVDGFRDEDIDFATRLNQAGVACELHVYSGAPHAFGLFPDTPVARQAAGDMDRWLRRRWAVAAS